MHSAPLTTSPSRYRTTDYQMRVYDVIPWLITKIILMDIMRTFIFNTDDVFPYSLDVKIRQIDHSKLSMYSIRY